VSRRFVLAAIAGTGVVNGLRLEAIPAWRQFLFAVLAVLAYLHGRHVSARRDWLLVAGAAVAGAGFLVPDVWLGIGALTSLALFVVLPWLAGRFRLQQADLVAAGAERIAQLELERELVAERARLRERARIAADMHDSLGHQLALIALRAGALELATDMTSANQEAAAELRVCAITATDRLRRTVGLLRDTEGAAPTEPPDESVEELVDRARDAGMLVELRHDRRPETLSPVVDRAVHRVVQESLTNAARHAPGADVMVRLEHTPEDVVVTVRNQDSGISSAPTRGAGGLAGLRERVRLLGGTLDAGPHDGGFTVTARIPLRSTGSGADR
jgi:signal transduction histidine kinase